MLSLTRKDKLFAAASLVSFFFLGRSTAGLDGTEFSGGWLTGPMLDACELGVLLFVVCAIVVHWHPRIAASIALLASAASLPLPAYFFEPGAFQRIVGGEWSVPVQANFVWSVWTVFPLIAFLGTITAAVSILFVPSKATT